MWSGSRGMAHDYKGCMHTCCAPCIVRQVGSEEKGQPLPLLPLHLRRPLGDLQGVGARVHRDLCLSLRRRAVRPIRLRQRGLLPRLLWLPLEAPKQALLLLSRARCAGGEDHFARREPGAGLVLVFEFGVGRRGAGRAPRDGVALEREVLLPADREVLFQADNGTRGGGEAGQRTSQRSRSRADGSPTDARSASWPSTRRARCRPRAGRGRRRPTHHCS